ncbi:MAG: ABC-F family ATP-binding cassette domain-containing protein [Flavobacteriaceae bacterium]|nr:ABC-F family ATP-binding cassette domain-containing protein [Flavobacteriaceae bacterium]
MNLLSVENIAKAYGERVLFSDISFGINQGQKIAFVAKNGSGKTSMLNIIIGEDQPDDGQVVSRNGIAIAFLAQEPELDENLTIEETIFAGNNPLLQIVKNYEQALENPEDTDAYQLAFDAMDQHQAWDFETLYKQLLSKLKLDRLQDKVASLSGGQRKRLALANILISKPDLLILDEPTNHLDLEMIEWLEDYFAKTNITLFMVTHDRYFLERVCNEIIELDQGILYTYKGNYSYYLEKKDARIAAEKASVEKAKNLYTKELDWMRRQPKARTTKSKSRIDDFYEIKAAAHKRRKEHQVQLEINMERLGSKIVELHNIGKRFGDKNLFQNFDYTFKKGERIGIIGKNGTGKSTFLQLLTKNMESDTGKVVHGETIKFGYYTQKGLQIKPEQKVIDVIREFGDYIPLAKGRQLSAAQLLERFLFDRKKQYDFVEKLSGGEKKRLYLCTILITNPNFLILDEPTNDLDLLTLGVLEQFLMDFPGCVLIVSHDRYFMDKIVDHLFVFKGNGIIDDFPGNYTDYRVYENSIPPASKEKSTGDKKNWKKDDNSRLSFNEQKELKKLESQIKSLEYDKLAFEKKFENPDLCTEEIKALSLELQELIDLIDQKTERWFELSAKQEQ